VTAPTVTKISGKSAAVKRKQSEDESESFGSEDEDESESDASSEGSEEEEKPKTKKASKPDSKKRMKDGKPKKPAEAKDAKKSGKDEKKMMTDKEAKVAIKEHMIKQKRPYSLQNVLDNMHGLVKRATAQKVLDDLSDDKTLTCKEFGKIKVYLANQDNFPTVSTEELAKIDEKIKVLKDDLSAKQAKLKDL